MTSLYHKTQKELVVRAKTGVCTRHHIDYSSFFTHLTVSLIINFQSAGLESESKKNHLQEEVNSVSTIGIVENDLVTFSNPLPLPCFQPNNKVQMPIWITK